MSAVASPSGYSAKRSAQARRRGSLLYTRDITISQHGGPSPLVGKPLPF